MRANYRVTNGQLFKGQLVDPNLDGLKVDKDGNGSGDVAIEWLEQDEDLTAHREWKCWTGGHGARDYEAEFGFIIVPDPEDYFSIYGEYPAE